MVFNRQEPLPERRDVPQAPGYGSRIRRGRRSGKITRRRCTVMALLPTVLFLLCVAFFSRNLAFNGSYLLHWKRKPSEKEALDFSSTSNLQFHSENMANINIGGAENDEIATTIVPHLPVQLENRKKRSKRRKQYSICEIDFLESVNVIVEPESYINCSYFLLEYIGKEWGKFEHGKYSARFGGHQTLEERENSFYARNQTLHCGFVKGSAESEGTGFDIDVKDSIYMLTCKVVVSSCIFGSSDFLRSPTKKKISGYSKNHVCFVMFLDEQTLKKLSSEGQIPDGRGYIGLWRIIVVRNLPYLDMRKTGKVPKFLAHRLFPSSRFSIWIDSKMRLNADPMLILEYFLWRKQSEYAISNHYDRHCVWDEVIQNKRLNKYNHTAIDEQFIFYQSDGLVKFNDSDENAPLPSYVPEGSFIVRAHTPMSNLFSCLWFNEVDRFTSRDQLSFAYTYLKLRRKNPDKPFFLNMFKDCERRALARLFHHRVEYPPPFRTA